MARIIKHGLSKRNNVHPLYTVWNGMMKRCNNPKAQNYKWYGAKGIKVCERWLNPINFIQDMELTYKKGLQLDRIKVSGDYEPSNCLWSTPSQNSKNKRNKAKVQSNVEYVSFANNKWGIHIRFDTQEEAESAIKFLQHYYFNRVK